MALCVTVIQDSLEISANTLTMNLQTYEPRLKVKDKEAIVTGRKYLYSVFIRSDRTVDHTHN